MSDRIRTIARKYLPVPLRKAYRAAMKAKLYDKLPSITGGMRPSL